MLSDPKIRVFLESPKISHRQKKEVLDRSFHGRLTSAVLNFLKILVDRNRQDIFGEIVESYCELLDAQRGRLHVRITSSHSVPQESWQRLVGMLERKHQKTVIAEYRLDKEMLGGVSIRIGDLVVDGSIRSQLNKIREALASQRLGSELVHED